MTAFTTKTWHKGAGGATPLNDTGLNDLEQRVADAVSQLETLLGALTGTEISQLVGCALYDHDNPGAYDDRPLGVLVCLWIGPVSPFIGGTGATGTTGTDIWWPVPA